MRLLLALAVALFASGALADHVYSHRYVLEGRVIGVDGLPVPGREVEFFAKGQDFLEPCLDGPHQSVTDQWGDFRFCFHHHELGNGTRVGVRVGNATIERPADVAMRRSVVTVREPNETGVAPEGWERSYRISGRAWQVGPTELEDVLVYGVTPAGLPVNLTVRADDGSEQVFRTQTDAFGDFDLGIEAADAENVTLLLEAMGRPQPVHLDSLSHRTYAPIYLPGENMAGIKDDASSDPPAVRPAAPGTSTPRMNPVLVAALALGLVGAILLSRRKN